MKTPETYFAINTFGVTPGKPYHLIKEEGNSTINMGDYPSFQAALDQVPPGVPCHNYVHGNTIKKNKMKNEPVVIISLFILSMVLYIYGIYNLF